MRLPIGMSPLATRMLPNHRIATVDRLKMSISVREHQGEQALDSQRGRRQVAVGDVEPLLLVAGADEGADDPDPAERLAGDLVDPVDLDLHRLEQRQRAGHQEPDDEGHERQDDDEDPRQRDVLAEGHDDPADREDRAR